MIGPVILAILLLACVVLCDLLGWKRGQLLFYIGSLCAGIFGQIANVYYMAKFYNLADQIRTGALVDVNPPAYGQYSIVCLFLAILFLTATVISLVMLIGTIVIKRREG